MLVRPEHSFLPRATGTINHQQATVSGPKLPRERPTKPSDT
ncbi:MAG: hypothetical protein PF961_21680 [Planctomycetota bacterium]|nr:hypothetical protein [Planctomycetota bacterium]